MEKKLDVFNLTYIRRRAEIEAKKKKEQEPKTWLGSVSNWWSSSKQEDDPGLIFQFFIDEIFSCLALDVEKVMTPDEKKKFFDAIGYEGEDTSKTSYPVEVSFENLNEENIFRIF